MKRVLLLYTGTITDIAALHWLKNRMKMKVYTYTPQLGYDEFRKTGLREEDVMDEIMDFGVESAYFGELKSQFYTYMIRRAIQCGLKAQNGNFLVNALAAPVVVRESAELAEENSCSFVAYTDEPFSMDHMRYSNLYSSIAPKIELVTPQTTWPMETIADVEEYVQRHRLIQRKREPETLTFASNIWGSRIKCGIIEDLWQNIPDDLPQAVQQVEEARDTPEILELAFTHGLPKRLNGEELSGLEMLKELNAIGIAHGVGRTDLICNELFGIKRRVLQEAPAAHILYRAHEIIEEITLSSEILSIQDMLKKQLCKIVMEGNWFTDLREAICSFFEQMQRHVNGTVQIKLFKGNISVVRRKAEAPLYDRSLLRDGGKGIVFRKDTEKLIKLWKTSKRIEKYFSVHTL